MSKIFSNQNIRSNFKCVYIIADKEVPKGANGYVFLSYDSFKKYGIENFKIIEIKKYDVYREYYKDYKHLQSKEQLWINKLKCVNSNCSFNPIPENEYKKYYRLNNKDKIKERKKEYHITNKDKIKEQRKIKITCECGSIYRKCDKARHERTNKHMNYINN